jgi:hypothetical protein
MKHTKEIKNVLSNYQKVAQSIEAKIKEAESIYQPDEAEKRVAELKDSLEAEKLKAQSVIKELADDGRADAKAWAELDGDKITSDYKLLEANAVNPERFSEMVEKYKDNGTMSHLLLEYAERRNKAIREESNNPLAAPTYNTGAIMTGDILTQRYTHEEKSALSIIDMMGGGYLGGAGSSMVNVAIENFGETLGV